MASVLRQFCRISVAVGSKAQGHYPAAFWHETGAPAGHAGLLFNSHAVRQHMAKLAHKEAAAGRIHYLFPMDEEPPSPATYLRGQDVLDAGPSWRYHISIHTGDVRGAGTPNPARLRIFGANTRSPVYRIGDENDNGGGTGFARNSVKRYIIEAPNLGSLKRIYIQKELEQTTELGSGWFLDEVVVTLPDGHRLTFPCQAWIGKSDDDSAATAEYERNLVPCLHPDPQLASNPVPVTVATSGIAIPHPSKLQEGLRGVNLRTHGAAGEDAYFHTAAETDDLVGMGVADGVYAWREQGIDAGRFSQVLMQTAEWLVRAGYSDVVRIAQICTRKVQTEGIYGSSTFCLAVVDTLQARLRTANLGDSGVMLIGSTPEKPQPHVKFRTAPLEHEFGRPFQLGHHSAADGPERCRLHSIHVRAGDIVIVGSDGLWDNLFDREVAAIAIEYHQAAIESASAAARKSRTQNQRNSAQNSIPNAVSGTWEERARLAAAGAGSGVKTAQIRTASKTAAHTATGTDGSQQGEEGSEVDARAGVSGVVARPSALARALVSAAYERSRDKAAFTPYSFAASEWFDQVYNGGKPDDITVVAAFVSGAGPQQE